jgi:hypothetical protein
VQRVGMRWRSRSGGVVVSVVPVCHVVRVRCGDLDASNESFRQFHDGGVAATSLDIAFPVGGVMMELQPNYIGSLMKTLSIFG